MLFTSLISDIKIKVLGLKPMDKASPLDYVPDLETGEGGFYRSRQAAFEINSKLHLYDLEKGFKGITIDSIKVK
jgi:hypothetical protein